MRMLTPQTDALVLAGTSVPLCADDQWIDRGVLYGFSAHWRRHATARATVEFKRSLLACPRVAVNRSYLVNSDMVATLRRDEADRRGLRLLFGMGAIRCILHRDTDQSFAETARDGVLHSAGQEVWAQTCNEAEVGLVRLAADNMDNSKAVEEKIERQFTGRMLSFLDSGEAHIDALALTAAPGQAEHFGRKLPDIRAAVARAMDEHPKNLLTRRDLYRVMVVEEASLLSETRIDLSRAKPFARELKQAIDLIYNTTATDAFGFRPFRSMRMVDRSDIGQRPAAAAALAASDVAAVAAMLLRSRLEGWTDDRMLQFNKLSLEQIEQIRSTAAWRTYRDAPEELAAPIARGERGPALVERLEAQLRAVQQACTKLCDEVTHAYGESVVTRPTGLARALRFSLTLGSNKIGGMAEGATAGFMLMGSSGALLGGAAGLVTGTLAGQQIERAGAWMIGRCAGGIEASRLPPFTLGDPSETIGDVLGILASDHGMTPTPVDRVADDLPAESFTIEPTLSQ